MKNMYDIRMLCKAVNLHHSVYYYHRKNKENSYKKEMKNWIKKYQKNLKNQKEDMVLLKSQKY